MGSAPAGRALSGNTHTACSSGLRDTTDTMFPIRQTYAVLRSTLQEPGGGAGFATLVDSVIPPAFPRSRSGAGIGACEGGGGAGSAGALAGDDAESNGEMVDVRSGGDVEVSPEPRARKKAQERTPGSTVVHHVWPPQTARRV